MCSGKIKNEQKELKINLHVFPDCPLSGCAHLRMGGLPEFCSDRLQFVHHVFFQSVLFLIVYGSRF